MIADARARLARPSTTTTPRPAKPMTTSSGPLSVRAPQAISFDRQPRIAQRLVFRHEESAGDEPFADDHAAEDGERRRSRSPDTGRRAPASPRRRCERVAAAPPRPRRARQARSRHRPGFVAGHARERERPADTAASSVARAEPALPARRTEAAVGVAQGFSGLRHSISIATRDAASARAAAARSSASPADTARSD